MPNNWFSGYSNVTNFYINSIFFREIRWLIETPSPTKEMWMKSGCKLSLRLDVSPGMFVNPDEIAESNRTRKVYIYMSILINVFFTTLYHFQLLLHIDGKVNVEAPAHEATEHTVYIYLNNRDIDRISIILPIHLRYQRGQITGG